MAEKKETLIDYVRWYGDITLEERPFNVIDNLILCELSYVDLSNVSEQIREEGMTLHEAYREIVNKSAYRLLTAAGGQQDFVEKCAESRRFGNIRLSHYVDVLDPGSTQFSAVHFEMNPDVSYIAFRGTDDSIIGWKEDFMISFMKTPAQESALKYCEQTMEPGRKYCLGGHSKGGNLAVFAAAMLSEEHRRQVFRVYNNDGPGFAPEVFDMERIREVYAMTTRVYPAYDIIGQLFWEPIEATFIVESVEKGILQHDLISWCVDGPRLRTAKELDPSCAFTNEMFRTWINSMPLEKREAFVNEFFDSMKVDGALTMEQVTKHGTKTLGEMIRNFATGNPWAMEAALALPKSAVNTARNMVNDKLQEIQDKVQEYKENTENRKGVSLLRKEERKA